MGRYKFNIAVSLRCYTVSGFSAALHELIIFYTFPRSRRDCRFTLLFWSFARRSSATRCYPYWPGPITRYIYDDYYDFAVVTAVEILRVNYPNRHGHPITHNRALVGTGGRWSSVSVRKKDIGEQWLPFSVRRETSSKNAWKVATN